MLAPASHTLFDNGILESGALENKWAMDPPEKSFEKSWRLVSHLGCERRGRQDTKGIVCIGHINEQKIFSRRRLSARKAGQSGQ